MSYRRSIFKTREPETNYLVEIAKTKESAEVVPTFTLVLYNTSCLYETENKANMTGYEFKTFGENEHEDKRRIEISITPNKTNFQDIDAKFRNSVKNAHGYLIIYQADRTDIIQKYENYLQQHNLASKNAAKTTHHYSNFNPPKNIAY